MYVMAIVVYTYWLNHNIAEDSTLEAFTDLRL